MVRRAMRADPDVEAMRKRGRPRKATAEQVMDTGLHLIDTEGLAAFTTHRLATELGVSEMTLYRSFESKEALLEAIVDRVLLAMPVADVDLPPFARLWESL